MAAPIANGSRFLVSHPAHFIALGFGSGLARFAPGTFGTVVAIPLYLLLAQVLAGPEMLIAIVAFFILGVWACGRTGVDLGVSDHGGMVWDEVVAFMLVLAIIPRGTWWWVAGFVIFRAFDIAKPPPIRWMDRRIKGGFGVMVDDIMAAFYTLIVLAIAFRFIGTAD